MIRVGGSSPFELAERKYRLGCALYSSLACIEQGWVPGAGVSLLQASKVLRAARTGDDARNAGFEIVALALEQPFRQLVNSAGSDPNEIMNLLDNDGSTDSGFNIETKQIEDVVAAAILDPKKGLVTALETAFSHAREVLQTSEWDLPAPIAP